MFGTDFRFNVSRSEVGIDVSFLLIREREFGTISSISGSLYNGI